MAEAYRTIPAHPDQWPGMVSRLQSEDKFMVNVCNNFGLALAGGVYGLVADAGADIFRGNGIGPLAKWVDDHIFFRIPHENVARYNVQRAEWRREIKAQGGRRQEGGRVWYGGKELPSSHPEEFDEDCTIPLQDLADASPQAAEDQLFAYANKDIDQISQRLGIHWEPSKTVPFGSEVPYLGFCWDLGNRVVHLRKEKKAKYLAVIAEWEQRKKHNLLEVQKLYGKLLHAAPVIPAERAHLTSLEAMLAICNNSPFIPRSPPQDTPSDLEWWKTRLHKPTISKAISEPQPLVNYKAYSDASSGFRIAITVGSRWRAWRLAGGWKAQGRDIQWAKAVGLKLLVIGLCTISKEGGHVKVYGDNWGVVEGWWKGSSGNIPTCYVTVGTFTQHGLSRLSRH